MRGKKEHQLEFLHAEGDPKTSSISKALGTAPTVRSHEFLLYTAALLIFLDTYTVYGLQKRYSVHFDSPSACCNT